MARPIDIGLIQARRKRIADMIATLQAEDQDLVIAERVLMRLALTHGSGELAGEGRLHADATVLKGDQQQPNPQPPAGKPEGIPAVSEMVAEALENAVRNGALGLKPAAILSYVKARWWPQAESRDVGPVAWRMRRDGRLRQLGNGEYALPEERLKELTLRLPLSAEPEA